MNPRIIEEKQITLIGMSFYGDPFDTHSGWDEDNQIGLLWKRFTNFLSKNAVGLHDRYQEKFCYEVHIYNEETPIKGLFEIFVGVEAISGELKDLECFPIELSIKYLPKTQYAIFTFQGQEIVSDWEKMLGTWMETSGFVSPYTFNFQCYDERFKGLDRLEESTLEVYVPIKKAP